jgi:hypothetical protein
VEEAVLMGLGQCRQHAATDDERLVDREPPGVEMGLEGDPGDVRLHPVEDPALAARLQRTDQVGALEDGQGGELLAQAITGRIVGGGHRADDDLTAVDAVDAAEGLTGGAGLEDARRPVACAEPSGPVLFGRNGCGQGVHPPGRYGA